MEHSPIDLRGSDSSDARSWPRSCLTRPPLTTFGCSPVDTKERLARALMRPGSKTDLQADLPLTGLDGLPQEMADATHARHISMDSVEFGYLTRQVSIDNAEPPGCHAPVVDGASCAEENAAEELETEEWTVVSDDTDDVFKGSVDTAGFEATGCIGVDSNAAVEEGGVGDSGIAGGLFSSGNKGSTEGVARLLLIAHYWLLTIGSVSVAALWKRRRDWLENWSVAVVMPTMVRLLVVAMPSVAVLTMVLALLGTVRLATLETQGLGGAAVSLETLKETLNAVRPRGLVTLKRRRRALPLRELGAARLQLRLTQARKRHQPMHHSW